MRLVLIYCFRSIFSNVLFDLAEIQRVKQQEVGIIGSMLLGLAFLKPQRQRFVLSENPLIKYERAVEYLVAVVLFIKKQVLTFDLIRPRHRFILMGQVVVKKILSLLHQFIYIQRNKLILFILPALLFFAAELPLQYFICYLRSVLDLCFYRHWQFWTVGVYCQRLIVYITWPHYFSVRAYWRTPRFSNKVQISPKTFNVLNQNKVLFS